MPTITFNAFSFLQKNCKKNIAYRNVRIKIADDTSIRDLISQMQLTPADVEVVMLNGKVAGFDTVLEDNDRVAFVPPGTPGPYRVLLGFKNATLR